MFSSRPTPTTARPPVVADACAGSRPPLPGSAIAARILSSTTARCSSPEGPTWNKTCVALPSSATSSVRSASGAMLYACNMSSPVGGSDVVPGTSASHPTVVAKLDAPASSLFSVVARPTRSKTKAPIWSVKTPLGTAGSVFTNTPSVVAKPVSFSNVRAFLIDVLDWFAQLIGSLSIFEPLSSTRPSTGRAMATKTSGSAASRGRLPRRSTVASTQLSTGCLVVGERRSREPMIVVGITTPAISRATMPIDSNTPKSCTIGTLEIFTVRKAMTAAIVAASSGGPIRRRVTSNGLSASSRDRSSSMRFWI